MHRCWTSPWEVLTWPKILNSTYLAPGSHHNHFEIIGECVFFPPVFYERQNWGTQMTSQNKSFVFDASTAGAEPPAAGENQRGSQHSSVLLSTLPSPSRILPFASFLGELLRHWSDVFEKIKRRSAKRRSDQRYVYILWGTEGMPPTIWHCQG